MSESRQSEIVARPSLSIARRWVVKIGSALLTSGGRELDSGVIQSLVQQLVSLRERGCEVVLVSSGAVAAGVVKLSLGEPPRELHVLQAAAAVGQSALIQAYEDAFSPHEIITALVLLSHADVIARDRYLNIRSTLNTLLNMGVVPIVNENDSVVTDEIRFGDNDTLAALVANLIDADALLILTDQDGMFDKNPSEHSDARLICECDVNDLALDDMAGDGGALGRGGMITKLSAARLAAHSGASTIIAGGRSGSMDVISEVAEGRAVGTFLTTDRLPQSARKQWLASLLHVKGTLILDSGAVEKISDQGCSLLPIGVIGVEGDFMRGDLVRCVDSDGREIARGLSITLQMKRGYYCVCIESLLRVCWGM